MFTNINSCKFSGNSHLFKPMVHSTDRNLEMVGKRFHVSITECLGNRAWFENNFSKNHLFQNIHLLKF